MNAPPYPIRDLRLNEVIDNLRSFHHLYDCDVELVDGTLIQHCTVEVSLGNIIAYDSLMDEAGNPFSTWTFSLQSER